MKINLKRAKDCKVEMTVEVEPDKAENRYQEILRNFQRQAHLPGYRPGKAPQELVEKKFSEEARDEVLKTLIPEIYYQSVQAQKVSPVSLPKISDIRYQRGQKLIFHAEFEEAPNVPLKNYKGLSLRRESSEVSDDELQVEVRALLESRAVFEDVNEVRPLQKGDFVVADVELWQDDKYLAGKKDILLSVEPGGDDDFFEKSQGAQIGETREILRAGKPFTRVTFRMLKKKRLPEFDDAFAKALGKESTEELKQALRKEMAAYKQSGAMEKMKQELFQKLLKMGSFSIPSSLVDRQKERLLEQTRRRQQQLGNNEELWKAELPEIEKDMAQRAQEQVKLYFILQKVADQEKIELDEVELTQRLQALVDQSGRPMEEVRRVFEEDLRESLREKKTVDFLIANAKFEEAA